MSKSERRRGFVRAQADAPVKAWEEAAARYDAAKAAHREAHVASVAADRATELAHQERAQAALRAAFAAELAARDALISTPPPHWGAFATKLRIVCAHADDVLDPMSPETAKALAEEPEAWPNTRRALAVYQDAMALHDGRPRGEPEAERAALARLTSARAAEEAADAAIAKAVGPEPAWPKELTFVRAGYVERLSTVGEIVDCFPRGAWDQLVRLAHEASAIRKAWIDRTPRELADAAATAFEEREAASEAVLDLPAASPAIMPEKVAQLAGWVVQDTPSELGAFNPRDPAHVEWAQSLPPGLESFTAIGFVVLYLDAMALSQREG